MKEHISKYRRAAIERRERSWRKTRRKVPFKDSSRLAGIYVIGLTLITTLILGAIKFGELSHPEGILHLAGDVFLIVFAVLGARALTGMLAPEVLRRNSRICLLIVISLLSIIISGAITWIFSPGGRFAQWSPYVSFLYPYLLAPALATLIFGAATGIVVGLGTSMLIALLSPACAALSTLGQAVFASILAPLIIHRKVRRRTQLIRACLTIALILAAVVFVYSMTHPETFEGDENPNILFYGMHPVFARFVLKISADLLYGLFIALILPMLEHFFAVASDISLNSFADLQFPLLRRLASEAPGTNSHSTAMATLAAAAADRIGANSLLARVGAYYHDIGKLNNPNFFIENITPERNPHRTLKPSTSVSWIKSHINDGKAMADKYRLPAPVKDILREHHGTTTMAVFLHKAREQARAEEEKQGANGRRVIVEESQFRYPGPKPSTRESGIIMLADSIEAAARTLEKPTPRALDSLVNAITEAKLKDGQLDECPLTLQELALIKQTFVATLATIHHARLAYPAPPEDEETHAPDESREPAAPPPAEPEPLP